MDYLYLFKFPSGYRINEARRAGNQPRGVDSLIGQLQNALSFLNFLSHLHFP